MNSYDSVAEQLKQILDECSTEISQTIERSFTDVAQETVDRLKQVSPKRNGGGAYAASWSKTKTKVNARGKLIGGVDVVVYNKKHYQLTHLLERGHVVRNQYGAPSRAGAKTSTSAQPHIIETENWATEQLVEELKRNL
jgi:hypothetical protein